MPAVTSCYKDTPLRGIPQGRVISLCLFYRRLDDGEPLVGILLIPDTVDINGAGSSNNPVALFLQIGEKFDIVVVQFVIRAEDFQASRQRHDRDVLEFDKSGVGTLFRDLLAILDVDVLRLVSAVFDGVALARFRAERLIVVTSPSGLTRFCSE